MTLFVCLSLASTDWTLYYETFSYSSDLYPMQAFCTYQGLGMVCYQGGDLVADSLL